MVIKFRRPMRENSKKKIKSLITFIDKDPFFVATVVLSIIFGVIFSWYSITKYLSMNATGFDLGLESNAFWNTLHGDFFRTNMLGESLLSEHFAPFYFIDTFVYFIYPSPISLLVFQGFLLSLAVIPLYKIMPRIVPGGVSSRKYFGLVPFAIAVSYELSPFTESIISFDLHNMAFLPIFFFMAIYAFVHNKRILNIVMLAFIISLHSNFVYLVALIVLFEIYYSRKRSEMGLIFSKKTSLRKTMSLLIIILAVLYIYLEFSGFMKGIISNVPGVSLLANTGETGTVPGGVIGLLEDIFTKPGLLTPYLDANMTTKIGYYSLLFSTTAFLSFLFPEALIMGIPYFLYSLPSSYAAYYQLGYEYTTMISTVIFLSVVFGISRLLNAFDKAFPEKSEESEVDLQSKKRRRSLFKYMSLFFALLLIIASLSGIPYDPLAPPNSFVKPGFSAMSNIGELSVTNETAFLIEVRNSIPQDSYILTQNNLMPFFANFRNIYMTIYSSVPVKNSSIDYIVYSPGSFWANAGNPSVSSIASKELSTHEMGIYANYQNVLLVLERNYSSSPKFYVSETLAKNQSFPTTIYGGVLTGNQYQCEVDHHSPTIGKNSPNDIFAVSMIPSVIQKSQDETQTWQNYGLHSGPPDLFPFSFQNSITTQPFLLIFFCHQPAIQILPL